MSKFSEKRAVNDIRLLALDMIDEAGTGHPGIALGAAPIVYSVIANNLVMDIEKKDWFNRDRFVMSAGHGSALLYATLFACCDDYSIDDLKNFRKLDSVTPGHPAYDLDHRIEVTTGPLGEGFATAVGMAMASKYLASTFNKKKETIFDYNVFALVSDGDLMEGISYEAMSLAGTMQLDNLIVLYDSNNISVDGDIEDTFTESVIDRFAASDWDVIHVKNGDSVKEIDSAIEKAMKNKRPTLIGVDTIIGIYSENEDTNKVHSGPLKKEDLDNIRQELGGLGAFCFDNDNMKALRLKVKTRCLDFYRDWYSDYELYMANLEKDVDKDKINSIINNEDVTLRIDKVVDTSKLFEERTMREINYQLMNVIASFVPGFIGGSADLAASTKTYLKGQGDFTLDNYSGRNIPFGVRENAMGAILNGLALCNLRPFGSTYLTFADYLKPSIRESAMMKLPVTYIFTHDSILNGQDGATHQPIEQLGMLRSIPDLDVYRPCDYKELIGSWNRILSKGEAAALVLSKGHNDTLEYTNVNGIKYGGYVISEVKTRLDVILIATGSEVQLAMKIKDELLKNYIEARVVSVPNLKTFLEQEEDYIDQVLPKKYKKVVIEYSNDPNWYRFVDSPTDIININHFGKSATADELVKDFELDITSLVIKIKNSI